MKRVRSVGVVNTGYGINRINVEKNMENVKIGKCGWVTYRVDGKSCMYTHQYIRRCARVHGAEWYLV